jgi:hypothetical protein
VVPVLFALHPPRRQRKNVRSDDERIVWGEGLRLRAAFRLCALRQLRPVTDDYSELVVDIRQYGQGAGGTIAVPLDRHANPPADADILVRGTSHIGFLRVDGRVVQAEDHKTGVHANEFYVPQEMKRKVQDF